MVDFSQQFRDAMAHLSAAVHIVTSNGCAGKVGITVSSVTSVCDNPPTLLFCINQNSELHNIIKQNGKVCVNVLNHTQVELAKHFAGMLNSTMAERFSWDIWQQGLYDVPQLKNAISHLVGDIIESYSVGSHSIFIVRLADIHCQPQHSLVYFSRQFKTVEL